MRVVRRAAVLLLAPAVLLATAAAADPVPDQPGTKRLSGLDRYATAAAIVRDSFPDGPVPVAVVATGEAFADALAGGPAADELGGPVLPVTRTSIPAAVRTELDRLDPGRIVVLGGTGAVSEEVVTELRALTRGGVQRIAGPNRYATAALVAREAFDRPVAQVVVATGAGFADALAGGAVAALRDSPVLLVAADRLPPETATALRELSPGGITVLGGTAAVSDAVVRELGSYTSGSVRRISGDSRFTTAAQTVQAFWPSPVPVAYLATGRGFPDALAGVPAAGLDGAPLLLVEPTCMPDATRQQLDRLSPETVVVLGGPRTVSDAAASGTACGPRLDRSGDPSHYTLVPPQPDAKTGRQVRVRWDPCREIAWKVNPGPFGAAGVAEAQEVAARFADRTGIALRYAGTTDFVPRSQPGTGFPDFEQQRARAGVPLVMAFVSPAQTDLYRGGEAGRGDHRAESSSTQGLRITDGSALVRSDLGIAPGFAAGRASRGTVMLHELGHAFGLDHYADPTMIMNPVFQASSPADLNNGDIAGLYAVGAAQGCT
jgi:putative cell wall-binding protein